MAGCNLLYLTLKNEVECPADGINWCDILVCLLVHGVGVEQLYGVDWWELLLRLTALESPTEDDWCVLLVADRAIGEFTVEM